MWVLMAAAFAWVAAPMALAATQSHTTGATAAGPTHFVTMSGNDHQGCGHHDHGDDNNGVGSDDDHDHDCNEEDDDTDG